MAQEGKKRKTENFGNTNFDEINTFFVATQYIQKLGNIFAKNFWYRNVLFKMLNMK